MKIHDVQQGSAEWLALRAKHYTASEAPAMLGLSKYTTRAELLKQKHLGITPEIDAQTQKLYDRGHQVEAQTRPIVEKIVGEEFYPATGTAEIDGLPLLASFDGLTMDEDLTWECKLYNNEFARIVAGGDLPDTHWPQVEQQLLVSGARRCLFTVSDGEEENLVSLYYESKPERRAQVIAGWKQFEADLQAYVPLQEVLPAAKAAPIESLPTLMVELVGHVKSTNLSTWQASVTERIKAIKTDLQTDEDFATADATVKFLDDAEKRVDVVKAQALAQTASIEELFKALDGIKAEMRTKRLNLDKLVKARKEAVRGEIVQAAMRQLQEHVAALNKRLGGPLASGGYMPQIPCDFQGAIKGRRTVASLQAAVDNELTQAQITANQTADLIEANLAVLKELSAGHGALFPDIQTIVRKPTEDLRNLIASRISAHTAAEAKRHEDERARIRAEEEARAKAAAEKEARDKAASEEAERRGREAREAAERRQAEVAAAPVVQPVAAVATDAALATPAPSVAPATESSASKVKAQIIAILDVLSEEDLVRTHRFLASRFGVASAA